MRVFKGFLIAFSLYSKIPMPNVPWEKEDMQYQLIFFPWVGGVIGLLLYLWSLVTETCSIGNLCYVLVGVAIPLLVTGGFHMDGFMDTMDAMHSYKCREEKLKILKDPHIGAFAVLMLVLYGLVYTAAFSEITYGLVPICGMGFFLARALSGIGVLKFPGAKKDGMLHSFSDSVSGEKKGGICFTLYVELVLCVLLMIWKQPVFGTVAVVSQVLTFVYYYFKSKKEFGGITGDTAGYFVAMSECVMLVALAVCNHLVG